MLNLLMKIFYLFKMKILVTGGCGFIGNYVVQELIKKNHDLLIIGTDIKKAKEFIWFNQVSFEEVDINNPSTDFIDSCKDFNKVIHLAWQKLPNYGQLFHMEENLPNQFFFLKKLMLKGIKDFTVIGTCFEYGLQNGCLSEDMPCYPNNYYALAKDTLRRLLELYCKEKNVNFKWLRPFYTFGEGQNPNSLFSQLEKAIDNKDPIFNMSGGDQLRDYLPVEKVAEYIIKVALQDRITGVINICSGAPVKLSSFVRDYIKQRNQKIELNLGYYPYSVHEPIEFWGDNLKLKQICHDSNL